MLSKLRTNLRNKDGMATLRTEKSGDSLQTITDVLLFQPIMLISISHLLTLLYYVIITFCSHVLSTNHRQFDFIMISVFTLAVMKMSFLD